MGLKLKNTNFITTKSFSINDVDVNEIAVSNKLPLVNKILNISLVTNILKKLDLYAYSTHKWLYIKEILMKIDVFIFWWKRKSFYKIHGNFRKS